MIHALCVCRWIVAAYQFTQCMCVTWSVSQPWCGTPAGRRKSNRRQLNSGREVLKLNLPSLSCPTQLVLDDVMRKDYYNISIIIKYISPSNYEESLLVRVFWRCFGDERREGSERERERERGIRRDACLAQLKLEMDVKSLCSHAHILVIWGDLAS